MNLKIYFFILVVITFFVPRVSLGGVIFEDDFNRFTSGWTPSDPGAGQHVTGGTLQNPGRNEPTGWTGWLHGHSDDYIAIVPNEGRNGTPALKLGPRPGTGQWNAIGLVKWLGPNGYDELYIRFFIKFDQNWRWGDGSNGSWAYHKLMRIWQNVSIYDVLGTSGKSIQDETDRGYMVFTLKRSDGIHPSFNLAATHNDGLGSVNGALSKLYYYPYSSSKTLGFLDNHAGGIDSNGNWTKTQGWHSVEIHIKLASAWPADDGVYELWIDGIKQDKYTWHSYQNATRTYNNMPAEKLGTGINYIVLHDNGNVSKYWSGYRYLWIDDVVISTSYIGPNYVIGGGSQPPQQDTTPPSPPSNLR